MAHETQQTDMVNVSIQFDALATGRDIAATLRELAAKIEQDGIKQSMPVYDANDSTMIAGAVMMWTYTKPLVW